MERGRHYELGQEIVPPFKWSETSPKNLELYYSAVIPACAGMTEMMPPPT